MEKSKIQPKHFKKLNVMGIYDFDSNELSLVKYQKGETILKEGFPMEYFMVVLSGKAKVYASADNGRDLLLCYYVEDGVIGDLELMMNTYVAHSTMVALTDFTCIAMPYRHWSEVLKNNPVFLNYIGRELALKLIQSSRKGVVTILHDGEERLCSYLLDTSPDGLLDEKLTNVSSAIGLSYRQTLRLLKRLCEQDIIKKEGNAYRISDREALRAKGYAP